MVYIKKSGTDRQVMHEKEARRNIRRNEDIRSGITKTSDCARGDFKMCRELDKNLKDYKNHKNPQDREKIKDEYFGRQQEYRNKTLGGGRE